MIDVANIALEILLKEEGERNNKKIEQPKKITGGTCKQNMFNISFNKRFNKSLMESIKDELKEVDEPIPEASKNYINSSSLTGGALLVQENYKLEYNIYPFVINYLY